MIELIKQRDAEDGGPSCLAMVAKHYGLLSDIDRLRELCSQGKDTSSLLGISKGAEGIGLKTVGGQITFKSLAKEATLPSIVQWEQNRHVVVYKVKRLGGRSYRVYVADPCKGMLTYSKEDFCTHWLDRPGDDKGWVLLLEPSGLTSNADGAKHHPSRDKHKFLWGYLRRYRHLFTQMILGLLLGSLLQLIFPLLTQAVVDTGIGGKDIGFIWLVLLAQLMLLLSRTAIDFIRDQILIQISTRLNISLVSDFFSKLMRLPMHYFDSNRLGELLQRMDDHHRVDQFLTYSGLSLSFSLFTFVAYGVVLAIYDIWIFVLFLLGSLLYAGWILIFLQRRKKLDYDYFRVSGHNHNVTYQLLNGMQEIKLQGCEAQKRWEWEEAQADIFKVSLKFLKLEQVQKAGSILITEGTNILITIIAATAVIHGDMTLGMMLAVQYIIGQLNSPVEQLIQYIYSWQDVSFSLDRIGDIHDEADEEGGERSLLSYPSEVAAEQSIVIKGLAFRYDPEGQRDVLSDINLTIPNGKVTAIVGASGSGKTTLIKLMLGFYKPLIGQIEVGRLDLKRFSPSWWRGECGVVMQEGYLFTDSIARNIALSDAKPTLERIRYAAQVANIAEEIESWPLGYNTVIGQEGQGLSEGQRQQILIARMAYRDSNFVFLDEATNALDATNERIVTERLAHFCKGKTAVVVAHRLSTIRHANQIVVMDSGRIAEIGNHEQLMVLKGKYFELVNNQMNLNNDRGEEELGATW